MQWDEEKTLREACLLQSLFRCTNIRRKPYMSETKCSECCTAYEWTIWREPNTEEKRSFFEVAWTYHMATYGESRTTAGHNVSGGCGPDSEVMGCELLASDWVNFDFYPAKTLVIYWKLAGGIKVVLLPKKLYI